MLEAVQQLVAHETPSGSKDRLDAFAAVLAQRWQSAGAETTILANSERGNHVRAVCGTTRADVKPALILCHYDTVWPLGSLATHPVRVEEGRAYGPGIFDMKTSLVLAEYALRAVRDLALALPRPVTLLATSDEEIGSGSSRDLIEAEALRSAYVLVLESPLPGGVLKTARKGTGTFVVETSGRAAHAGVDPYKGINAIAEMAHQVLILHGLADREAGTTVSVGTIAGGTATNVVPAHCKAMVDVRSWTQAEADRIAAAMAALQPVLPGAQIRVDGGWNRPPLERKATAALFTQVQAIGRQLGLELAEGSTGGGSDGNFTGALGIPTLDGLGTPGDGAHADHEHIVVAEIPVRAALLAAVLTQL